MGGGRLSPPLTHSAGTDRLGREMLTQVMIGSRIALEIGIGAVLVEGAIGILIAVPTLLIAMLELAAN